jgi:hypothetical protein
MVAARGAGSSYTFDDDGVVADQKYYYWLQEVETSGKTNEYGPAGTDGSEPSQPSRFMVFLPMVSR